MSEDPTPRPRLDEGLRSLRELGYLRSPAELYVARKLSRRRNTASAALVVGFWTGGGAGLIVGVLLALSALLVAPSLLDRPVELAWLFFDLIGAAVIGGILVLFLCVWPFLRWISRRPLTNTSGLQSVAALLPGLLLALYLLDATGRVVLPRSGGNWLVAAGLVLLCTAIGTLVSLFVEALLAVARLRVRGDWQPPRLRHFSRLRPFFALLIACSALMALGPYVGRQLPPRLDDLTLPAPDRTQRILVLAVDGVEADMLLQGAPLSLRLRAALTAAEPCVVDERAQSPASFWNEIATGFPESEHGLAGVTSGTPHGIENSLDSIDRSPVLGLVARVLLPGIGLGTVHASDQRELIRPPLWEILAQAGGEAAAINWWATYPAANHDGLHVASDRWFLRLWESRQAASADSALRSPDAYWAGVASDGGDLLQRSFRFRAQRRAIHAGDSLLAQVDDTVADAGLVDLWSYATTSDAFHGLLVRELLSQAPQHQLVALHLNGADMLDRRLRTQLRHADDPTGAAKVAVALRQAHAHFLAQILDEVLAAHDGPTLLLIGRSEEQDRRRRVSASWIGDAAPLPATPRECVPILLRELGLPDAADMDAPSNWPERAELPSYGLRPRWTPSGARHRIDLERLRSLGYIGG